MKIVTFIMLAVFTVACSSNKASQTKINSLEVSEKLVKGKTTQKQVLEDFGAPDVVEKTPEGDMWAYSRYSNESDSVGGGMSHYFSQAALWNLTGISVGADKSTSSTKTASLVVYFNSKRVVQTYTFRTEKY